MPAHNSTSRSPWWRFIRYPERSFRTLFAGERGSFNILVILLAGIAIFQIWADIFNLADTAQVGKIMTLTLLLGPIAGLLLAIFLTAFGLALGHIMDPDHRVAFVLSPSSPPFPLKNLLWRRILGPTRVNAMLQSPALNWYSRAWSWLRSRGTWLSHNLSGGKVSFGQIFSGLSAILSVLIFANFFLWLELVFYDGTQFFSVSPDGEASPLLFLLIKLAFLGWFLFLWWRLLKVGFAASLLKSVLSTILSFLLAALLTLMCLQFIFQLPVF